MQQMLGKGTTPTCKRNMTRPTIIYCTIFHLIFTVIIVVSIDSPEKVARANGSAVRVKHVGLFSLEETTTSRELTSPERLLQENPLVLTDCPSEKNTFFNCLSTNVSAANSDACVACVNDAFAISSNASCSAFDETFCPHFSEKCIACGVCYDSIAAYATCVVGNCSVDCGSAATLSPGPPVPTSSPSPSSTPDACTSQETAYISCLSNDTEANVAQCLLCGRGILESAVYTTCAAFVDSVCPNWASCDTCGSCLEELQSFVECEIGCPLECGQSTSSSSTPTAVPTARCTAEAYVYQDCVRTQLEEQDVGSCLACVRDAFARADYNSCEEFVSSFCPSISICTTCGACLQDFEDYADCYVGGDVCTIACNENTNTRYPVSSPVATSVSPTEVEFCEHEENEYQTCLNKSLDAADREACRSCMSDALRMSSLESCTTFIDTFCASFNLCSVCEDCSASIVDFIDCYTGNICGVDCGNDNTISRPPMYTPTTPPLPSNYETSAPTPIADGLCSSVDIAFQTCLNTSLTDSDAEVCVSCANDAYYSASFDSCASFVDSFCSNSDQCTDCGSCLAVWVDLVDCQFNRGVCNVTCTGSTSAPTEVQEDSTFLSAARCPDELSAFDACVADKGLSSAEQISCLDCADRALGSSTLDSCDSFVGSFCPAFGACADCGSCASSFGAYYICAIIGPDCSGSCKQR